MMKTRLVYLRLVDVAISEARPGTCVGLAAEVYENNKNEKDVRVQLMECHQSDAKKIYEAIKAAGLVLDLVRVESMNFGAPI